MAYYIRKEVFVIKTNDDVFETFYWKHKGTNTDIGEAFYNTKQMATRYLNRRSNTAEHLLKKTMSAIYWLNKQCYKETGKYFLSSISDVENKEDVLRWFVYETFVKVA